MLNKVTISNTGQRQSGVNVALQCPHCGHKGTFQMVGVPDVDVHNSWEVLGVRRCPNTECHGHLFFVKSLHGRLETYPVQRVDFDSTDIPETVRNAFSEALDSHANGNYIASAIMVRKTLEEICLEQGAKGGDLKSKIQSLQDKVILPPALLKGADDLRLLGNDAAHVESQTFNKVGKEEIEIAVDFLKEFLKAIYQYNDLLTRMQKLKRKDD